MHTPEQREAQNSPDRERMGEVASEQPAPGTPDERWQDVPATKISSPARPLAAHAHDAQVREFGWFAAADETSVR